MPSSALTCRTLVDPASDALLPPAEADVTLVVDIDAATAEELATLIRETDPASVTVGG